MTRAEFLDQLGVVQLLPGPNSTELAIHVGHARGGWRGALVAGLGFVLPSVMIVWGLAAIAGERAVRPAIGLVLWWLVPVVVAVLLQALWTFGKQAAARANATAILPLVGLVAIVVQADLIVLLVGAALAVLLTNRPRPGAAVPMTVLGLGVALTGAALSAQTDTADRLGSPATAAILLYFLRAGVSVFGSGYVLLAFLQNDLVDGRGWLSTEALAQAAAFAQVTPGPLFSTATAVGYSVGGHLGALAATVGVFAPAFLSVAISTPIRRLVQRSVVTRAALDGVVLASVALLGRALVGFAWPMRSWQWVVCLLAAVLLLRTRVSASVPLLAAATVGLVAYFLHFTPS
jgi:chromate transporter